jgi:uncharacterized membrane protein YhaH (DUF805 family)
MEWMLLPLKRYAEFSGRSRRKEFWMFQLLNLIVVAVLYAMILGGGGLSALMAGAAAQQGGQPDLTQVSLGPVFWIGALLLCIWGLGTIIPALAVTVRRLHDRNMSGWYLLGFIVVVVVLSIVPVVGPLIVFALEIGYIVLLALPGTPGTNDYGPDPLGNVDPEVFA